MDDRNSRNLSDRSATASLEFLTGPARGTASWLTESTLDVSLNDVDMIRITKAGVEQFENGLVARLHRSGGGYEIEAHAGSPLWINGEQVDSKQLEARDLLEFGDKGPLSRYRVHRQGDRVKRSLGDMLDDCLDYTRVSRKPLPSRVSHALRDMVRDMVVNTTLLFRFSVIVALIVLGVFTYQQYRSSMMLHQQAAISANQLEDFARTLTRTNQEALRSSDLKRLRQELRHSLTDTAERLKSLEKRGTASTRVIAEATNSIVFLQGAYAFRDIESQRMLRYRTDEEGNPLFTPRGQPVLTLEGEGEIAERPFTGTGFVVSQGGELLTNRHVALPWEDDTSVKALIEQGMEAVLTKFVGYVPGIETAIPVELLKASDEADLAVLKCNDLVSDLPYLRLGQRLPEPGDEVIVMGYPTGMRSMLAQTGEEFLEALEKNQDLDFWQIAARLSQAKFIRPLASRGIVGQRSIATVVYDADTTHGGSGGPVLDIHGDAIAVNTAIIPEYGGSNFGVPVEFARRLLRAAGIEIEQAGGSTKSDADLNVQEMTKGG